MDGSGHAAILLLQPRVGFLARAVARLTLLLLLRLASLNDPNHKRKNATRETTGKQRVNDERVDSHKSITS